MTILVVIYLSVSVLAFVLTTRIEKIKKKLSRFLSKKDFWDQINKYEMEIDIIPGKYYAYNPYTKQILYEDKDGYSEYDLLGMFHEMGHYNDDKVSGKIYRHMKITAINRLFLVPLHLIMLLGHIFNMRHTISFHSLLIVVNFICFIDRIYYICKYEKSASDFAIKVMNEKSANIERLKKIVKLSKESQLCLSVFGFGTLTIIYYFCINLL